MPGFYRVGEGIFACEYISYVRFVCIFDFDFVCVFVRLFVSSVYS